MKTQKLFGRAMLMDNTTNLVTAGDIAFMFVPGERGEIQIRNDDTGETASIEAPADLVEEIANSVRSIFTSHDIQPKSGEMQ